MRKRTIKAQNSIKNSHRADHLAKYRWVKGQPSPNPGGRPKNAVTEASREWLEQVDPATGLTHAQMMAAAQGVKALEGDTAAFAALADRAEGRPKQTTDVNATVNATVTDIEPSDEDIRKRRQKLLAVVQSDDATAIVLAEREQS